MSAILQTTRTEFLAPVREDDEWGQAHNAPDALGCVGYGTFEQLSGTRTVMIYGRLDVRAWRWHGTLPRGNEVDSRWTARATLRGKDRTFGVRNASFNGSWSIDLQEVE